MTNHKILPDSLICNLHFYITGALANTDFPSESLHSEVSIIQSCSVTM